MKISIVPADSKSKGPKRSATTRALADIQNTSKLDGKQPTDEVEGLKIEVKWEVTKWALGVAIEADEEMEGEVLVVDPGNLDFEKLLKEVIWRHTRAVLRAMQRILEGNHIFAKPGVVVLKEEGQLLPALLAKLGQYSSSP